MEWYKLALKHPKQNTGRNELGGWANANKQLEYNTADNGEKYRFIVSKRMRRNKISSTKGAKKMAYNPNCNIKTSGLVLLISNKQNGKYINLSKLCLCRFQPIVH